jgi:hypothetical protein
MKTLHLLLLPTLALSQLHAASPVEKFQQLDQMLPAPSPQRIASGAPGSAY